MNRHQNRSRSRDNYGNNNRNRPRNNDNRRRDDFDRNSNRYQGGGGGGRRDDQGARMTQMNRGSYGMSAGGYSQNMGMYGGGQPQMSGYGGYGATASFQQNRFGVNQAQQQMINPWANNMMPAPMGTSGDEAKLAMNILNAVLSSGPDSSSRGMDPPPNKMRRMDFRDGGYDDRRRRPRSPPGRSPQNRQQFSQRFGSDRRGRDGHSSYQGNDDHRFRNSFSKSPGGVSRSSRQSSEESSEFVFRKRLSFEERERESKKYKDLPAKALKCRMCEKSTFHNVAAYLAHVDSKGHNKVARAFHEKIAATATLLKHNARLALQKELRKAKAGGVKVVEKECHVCEGPMVYGNLKHKNILACKILHKYQNQTLCCDKDHKSRSLVEEHGLSLAHLQTKYEAEKLEEEKETSVDAEEKDEHDENAEDEEERIKRLKRDEARRKRKYGEDETDEEEDEDEEEEKKEDDEVTDEKREEETNENRATTEEAEHAEANGDVKENDEGDGAAEQMESKETEEKQDGSGEGDKEVEKEKGIKEEPMETSHDEKGTEGEVKKEIKTESITKEEKENGDGKEENKDSSKGDPKDKGRNRRRNNKSKLKRDQDEIDRYEGKTLAQLTFQELLEFHKKSALDDPEKMGSYDPALPTGLNYIDTRVCYHCMACLEYCAAFPEDLKAHSCSKDHYDLFRGKYMKVKGVRDSPTSLRKLKNAMKKDSKEDIKDKESETKEVEASADKVKQEVEDVPSAENEEAKDKPSTESEDVGGDDALYDPYEGESGDLTAMLQEKETPEEHEEAKALEGYEIQDEAHESEAENYEDNILDYEEDVAEDEEKDENKDQAGDNEGEDEGDEDDENEESQDGEGEEEEEDGDGNYKGEDDAVGNCEEEAEVNEECQEEDFKNEDQDDDEAQEEEGDQQEDEEDEGA